MRINKYLSSKGICSRRKVDELIENKKIVINGKLATIGMDVDDSCEIKINGKIIKNTNDKKVYFLLNKPLNVISASSDDRGRKTVVDLIKTDKRIFPIGRLDFNSTGLLILTNDGELFNRIIHPKAEVFKKYKVLIVGDISDEDVQKLRKGIEIENYKTLGAKISIIKKEQNRTELYVSIREGKNRQIRKMFGELKYKVVALHRESLGLISLGDLQFGEYRELTEEEVEYLYSL